MKSLALKQKEIRLAGEACFMEDALAAGAAVRDGVTVILLPLACRDEAGYIAVSSEWKSRKLVAITLGKSIADVQAALQMGARAILCRTCPQDHILRAIHDVAANELYVSQEIASLIAANAKSFSRMSSLSRLTQRELEILKRIAIGRRTSTIGVELGISVKTVSAHKSNILEKLLLSSDSELVLYAMKNDLFDLFVDHAKRKKNSSQRTKGRSDADARGKSVISTKTHHETQSGTGTHRRHRHGSVSESKFDP
ncbi:LuxR C-terminal-related transcriptional regulator [Massilia aerilata]|uniref:LuxR C-terminal-related transcriptional regulator n=1 Tax=Massilia aerilata TaxID=453817 RepID=A0ABW0S196_9BURK